MKVDYTLDTGSDQVHVGKLENGQTMAYSMLTGLKASHINPLVAITRVIGSLTPADRRALLREVADRV